jgi:hypothetical protein
LINNLREQLGDVDVDIDVDIDMGDMDESEDEDDEDDGLSTGSEEEGHSDDEHAQEGMAGEQVRGTGLRTVRALAHKTRLVQLCRQSGLVLVEAGRFGRFLDHPKAGSIDILLDVQPGLHVLMHRSVVTQMLWLVCCRLMRVLREAAVRVQAWTRTPA